VDFGFQLGSSPYWYAAASPLLGLAGYVAAVGNTVGFQVHPPRVETRPMRAFRAHLSRPVRRADRVLRRLGFQPTFCVEANDLFCRGLRERLALVYVNDARRTFATVASADTAPGVDVAFATVYTDGTLLLTVNRRRDALLQDVPRAIVTDPHAPTLRALYWVHENEAYYSDVIARRVAASEAVYASRMRAALEAYVSVLAECGCLRPRGAQGYRVALGGIVHMGPRLMARVWRRLTAWCRARLGRPLPVPPRWLDVEGVSAFDPQPRS